MFREFLVIGDVGVGFDDVGEGGAGRFEAGFDVLPDLLDLGAHVALPHAIAVGVAGELPGDKEHAPGAADSDDMRVSRLPRPDHDMDALRLDLFPLDRHCLPFPYNAVIHDTPRARL